MDEAQFKILLRQLDRKAYEIQTALDVWLFRHGKRGNYRKAKRMNALQLLKLKLWSLRYQIAIDECVDILIPAFNKFQWGGRAKKKFGTGISIPTLVSFNAERILKKELLVRYPENQHRMIWREQLRHEQLEQESLDAGDLVQIDNGSGRLMDSDSVDEFVSGYRDRVTKQREEYEREVNALWRRRKNYRGNPWRGD